MATFHVQMTAKKQHPLSILEEQLCISRNYEFCSKAEYSLAGSTVLLLTFEQYFCRAGGTISLSVLLTESGDQQTADLIATGGGEGLSWSGGACRSFVKEVAEILASCGFADTNPEPEEKLHKKIFNYFFD